MNKLLSILLVSCMFAGELEVEGGITATGEIQSPTIAALLAQIADLQSQLNALQGGNRLETRVYEKSLSWSQNAEEFNFNLQEITGFDLQTAIVNFYSIKDLTITGDELEFELYLQNEGPNSSMAIVRTVDGVLLKNGGFSPDFIYSNSLNNYVIRVLQGYQTPGQVTIEFAITSQFPDSDVQLRKTGLQSKDKEKNK